MAISNCPYGPLPTSGAVRSAVIARARVFAATSRARKRCWRAALEAARCRACSTTDRVVCLLVGRLDRVTVGRCEPSKLLLSGDGFTEHLSGSWPGSRHHQQRPRNGASFRCVASAAAASCSTRSSSRFSAASVALFRAARAAPGDRSLLTRRADFVARSPADLLLDELSDLLSAAGGGRGGLAVGVLRFRLWLVRSPCIAVVLMESAEHSTDPYGHLWHAVHRSTNRAKRGTLGRQAMLAGRMSAAREVAPTAHGRALVVSSRTVPARLTDVERLQSILVTSCADALGEVTPQ